MKKNKKILISQARVHNLKSIDLAIPRDSLTVITGPSGSGKSSLAFDILFVEGQRRYLESLSLKSRQILGELPPPEVDYVDGLTPTLCLRQHRSQTGQRSTVGTMTEIYNFLGLLFAKIGTFHCPNCSIPLKCYTSSQMTELISSLPAQSRVEILVPIVCTVEVDQKALLSKFLSLGHSRFRINGELILVESIKDPLPPFDPQKGGCIEVVVDRIILRPGIERRIVDSIEYALKLGASTVIALVNQESELFLSEKLLCPKCKIDSPALGPQSFSFNSPQGACQNCKGMGEIKEFDSNSMVVDPSLSIADGAILPLKRNGFLWKMIESLGEQEKVNLSTPFQLLPSSFINLLFNGGGKIYDFSIKSGNSSFSFKKPFSGINVYLEKKYRNTLSENIRKDLERFMRIDKCPQCQGSRLNPWSSSVRVDNYTIGQLSALTLEKLDSIIDRLRLNLKSDELPIAERPLVEMKSRLNFLLKMGLSYLVLNRTAISLSGGEFQRIQLGGLLSSTLSGVTYILDEPSIGLHARDISHLIASIKDLRDAGNTVIVVEHDREFLLASDYLIEMGPGAGINGGTVVAQGPPHKFLNNNNYLSRILQRPSELTGHSKTKKLSTKKGSASLVFKGINKHNLIDVDLEIPLHQLVCLTGVSGSGKSTLVHEIIAPALKRQFSSTTSNESFVTHGFKSLIGHEKIQSVIDIDQSPIGKTPRSTPASYCGIFNEIRVLLSQAQEAQLRGYSPSRFGLNFKGGRCEDCEGQGIKSVEMHFLPDVQMTCPSCHGRRYNNETLQIYFKGKNAAEILEMDLGEAYHFFINQPPIKKVLEILNELGLEHLKLGQPTTTLSGGEAQRLKLGKELAKNPKGHCLYLFDEPTTGLHFSDVQILLKSLKKLKSQGHSLIVIEHNLDVISEADYIIDLGPEGGDRGGKIIATGSPQEISKDRNSFTGNYLKRHWSHTKENHFQK